MSGIEIKEDLYNNRIRVPLDEVRTPSPEEILMAEEEAENKGEADLLAGMDRTQIRRALLACEG